MTNDIVTIISSVGFPIFCACAMGFYVYKCQTATNQAITELRASVDRQTEKIIELLSKLENRKED